MISTCVSYPLRRAHVVECLVKRVARRTRLNDVAIRTEIGDVGGIFNDVGLEFCKAGCEPSLDFDLPLVAWQTLPDEVGEAVAGEEGGISEVVNCAVCCCPDKGVVETVGSGQLIAVETDHFPSRAEVLLGAERRAVRSSRVADLVLVCTGHDSDVFVWSVQNKWLSWGRVIENLIGG